MKHHNLITGASVFFHGEKQPFKIKARTSRYAICTKPFNLQRTVTYCIIDFEDNKRAPNDLVLSNYDYKSKEDIDRCMIDLIEGKVFLSRRNGMDLDVDTEKTPDILETVLTTKNLESWKEIYNNYFNDLYCLPNHADNINSLEGNYEDATVLNAIDEEMECWEPDSNTPDI